MRIHWIKSKPGSICTGLAEVELEDQDLINQHGSDLKHLHPKKKMEFLASRQLIREMCEQMNIAFHGIHKDEFGKPYLIDSAYHISISHSYPMVACALHPNTPCGIDIESARSQLLKIKHKFLNKEELEFCGEDLNKLCLHWSTKEALYKIYGRKRLIFAEQLAVLAIGGEEIKAQVTADRAVENYILNYEYYLEYFIVYNV
ncbi:MAG: 4'-phosphopantetheinyl transferase superfamily protein [Reichenbachiella sp.]|uniref:4'-phosphopantetheinyl transferase family protein n=1 Tax=Reichenbachiella sp. TaxID=2184521 RepID=UPI0032645F6D